MRQIRLTSDYGRTKSNHYESAGIAAWAVVIGIALTVTLLRDRDSMYELARAEARTVRQEFARSISASVGSPDHRMAAPDGASRAHFAILQSQSPAGQADDWEQSALALLAGGRDEVSAVTLVGGRPHMRLIGPLVLKPSCRGCDEGRAVRLGPTQGGISVAVPMAPIWSAHSQRLRLVVAAYGVLWLVGRAFLAAIAKALRRPKNAAVIVGALHDIPRPGRQQVAA